MTPPLQRFQLLDASTEATLKATVSPSPPPLDLCSGCLRLEGREGQKRDSSLLKVQKVSADLLLQDATWAELTWEVLGEPKCLCFGSGREQCTVTCSGVREGLCILEVA